MTIKKPKRITRKAAVSLEYAAWVALGRAYGFTAGIDTRQSSTRIVADLLVDPEMTARKLAWVRTRINQAIEARTGTRSPSAGRGRDKKVRVVDLS